MKELMADYDRLEEEKICIGLRDKKFESPHDSHPLEPAIDQDLHDPHFLYQMRIGKRAFNGAIAGGCGNPQGRRCSVRPPRYKGDLAFAEMCSERLNTTLFFAEANIIPVSTNAAFVSLLNAKVQRFLQQHGPELGVNGFTKKTKARFSMLSWQLLTEVASNDVIDRRSVEEILKYRQAAADPSKRFRAFIFELESEKCMQQFRSVYSRSSSGSEMRRLTSGKSSLVKHW
jgi:hypothetical protein